MPNAKLVTLRVCGGHSNHNQRAAWMPKPSGELCRHPNYPRDMPPASSWHAREGGGPTPRMAMVAEGQLLRGHCRLGQASLRCVALGTFKEHTLSKK